VNRSTGVRAVVTFDSKLSRIVALLENGNESNGWKRLGDILLAVDEEDSPSIAMQDEENYSLQFIEIS
jgi:hypothetical protein